MLKNKSLLVSGISLIITIVMMVTLCSVGFTVSAGETIDAWDGTAATSFAGGDGSEENPFKIENGGQLYKMVAEYSNTAVGTKPTSHTYFRIIKDINLNGKQWYDIGKTSYISNSNYKTGFSGIIYGDGHKITGLYTNKVAGATGLIPIATQGAEIHDLHLENGDFKKTAWNAYSKGAFIGSAIGSSSSKPIIIEGCSVKNFEIVAKEGAAAFVGYTYSQSFTIENCYCENVNVSITATSGANAGAFLGRTAGNDYGNTIIIRDSHCAEVSPTIYWNSDAFKSITTFTNVYTCNEAYDSSITGVTKLTTDQMKGAAAKTNMQGFAWDEVWYTTENGYPTLTAPAAPEEPECEHETTKDAIIEEATYFKAGLKNIVCADDACGAMVETDVVIPAADVALKGDFTETFADGKLTIAWEYSDALALDIANGAVITFNYEIAGYKNAVELTGETGETVILEGFNADRLNAELTYNLSAVYGDVDTTKLNAVGGAVKAADIANDEKLDALLEALEADAVVNGKAENTQWLVSNIAKLDLKAAKAELNVAASQELIDALAAKGGRTDRAVKLIVKIGDNFTKEIEINDLRKYTIVTISGLSFEQLNGDISVQLVFDYVNDEYDFATDEIVFACGDMIANANTAATNAFAAYMSK